MDPAFSIVNFVSDQNTKFKSNKILFTDYAICWFNVKFFMEYLGKRKRFKTLITRFFFQIKKLVYFKEIWNKDLYTVFEFFESVKI